MGNEVKTSTIESHNRRINFLVDHISENIDEEYTVADLANMVSMSQFHFHRVFKSIVGEPVKNYIRGLRLKRAANDLLTTDKQIKKIQEESLYASAEAFSRAFKFRYGISPSQYRNKLHWEQVAKDSIDKEI